MSFLRNILLVIVAVLYHEHFWLQMIVLFNSSILLIIAGGHINVRNSKYDGNMDTFNEVRLIFIMYHMMLFTMYVSDLGVKV